MELPVITIIIPTLNSEKTIGLCLHSILNQNYPKDKIEIMIVDGGSRDCTIDIVNSANILNIKIVSNRLKTGEAGKAVGAKMAVGDIIAFIDSDNILPNKNWLKRMIEPFSDPEIIASEPLEYTYRKTDSYITRYCALIGMNDPLCLFLGNYDRYNYITNTWTELPHGEEDKGNYLKIELYRRYSPTIGANGFLIRRNILNQYDIGDYLFDIDIISYILERANSVKVAKVKTGIIHVFAGNAKDFSRKQNRRIKDYIYYKRQGLRKYQWDRMRLFGLVKFGVYNILLFPLLFQALKGFSRKKDPAWFFHIFACVMTFLVYSFSSIQGFFVLRPLNRDKWQSHS